MGRLRVDRLFRVYIKYCQCIFQEVLKTGDAEKKMEVDKCDVQRGERGGKVTQTYLPPTDPHAILFWSESFGEIHINIPSWIRNNVMRARKMRNARSWYDEIWEENDSIRRDSSNTGKSRNYSLEFFLQRVIHSPHSPHPCPLHSYDPQTTPPIPRRTQSTRMQPFDFDPDVLPRTTPRT